MSTSPLPPKPPPEPPAALGARIAEHEHETMRLVTAQRHRCAALEAECDEANLAASKARKARDKGVSELYRIIDEREHGLREVRRGQQALPFAGTLPETPPPDPATIRAALGLVDMPGAPVAPAIAAELAPLAAEGDAAAKLVASIRARRGDEHGIAAPPAGEDPWTAPVSRLADLGLLPIDREMLRADGIDTIAQLSTFTHPETLSDTLDCSEAAARRMLGALARYRELHPGEPAIAAGKAAIDSLETLPPDQGADAGDWRALPAAELQLEHGQAEALFRLGIHTAGQLDDMLEGRLPPLPENRHATPRRGTPPPEWTEAFRAPFRAALAAVKPPEATKSTWHHRPIEDLRLADDLLAKASAAGIETAGQLDEWIESDAARALSNEEIDAYDAALRRIQGPAAETVNTAAPGAPGITTVDSLQWIWKGLREQGYLGAIPAYAVLAPKQATPVYALIAVDAQDAAAYAKGNHPAGTNLTTVPLTRELAKGRPGVHTTPAARAVLEPKTKAHAKGNGKVVPEPKPAPIGTVFSVRRHGSTKPYYYVRALSLRDASDYVHKDMPNATRLQIKPVEERDVIAGLDVRDLTTGTLGTDPLGVYKPAAKTGKSSGARPSAT